MSQEDFNVESLAAYLHLSPQQASRLAEREKIPARKVGGEWIFSAADVHHWLEERLGLLEDEKLTHVEAVLKKSGPTGETPISISSLLLPAAIATPLVARTRRSVIDSICELAVGAGRLWDAAAMAEAVLAREDMQPTAMENGVALLHPRRPMPSILAEPLLALGITQQGIPFGGARGVLTDVFFLIGSVDDRGHLRTLARLSRMISDDEFVSALRMADDAKAVLELIERCELEVDE